MGIPQHYSLEIPTRCLHILELIEETVAKDATERFGGAVTTTMMLTLATPMISLPIERIFKQAVLKDDEGYADDRWLDISVTEELSAAINKKPLGQNEHFGSLGWSFVNGVKTFNVARRLASNLAEDLNSPGAKDQARAMPMTQFVSCIRNALAYGGIMYLDEHGHSSDGTAAMLLFVSANPSYPDPVFDEGKGKYVCLPPVTASLKLLRIGENEFRTFLKGWIDWLHDLGVLKAFRSN